MLILAFFLACEFRRKSSAASLISLTEVCRGVDDSDGTADEDEDNDDDDEEEEADATRAVSGGADVGGGGGGGRGEAGEAVEDGGKEEEED